VEPLAFPIRARFVPLPGRRIECAEDDFLERQCHRQGECTPEAVRGHHGCRRHATVPAQLIMDLSAVEHADASGFAPSPGGAVTEI
jgi:hypothetical protein